MGLPCQGTGLAARAARSCSIWGLGGLTVLAEIRRLRGDVEIAYVADAAAFPYGRLSEAERISLVKTVILRVIPDLRPDVVVIA
jgi:glutamate racemase